MNTSGEIVGMILAVLTEPTNPNASANVLFEKQGNADITQFLIQPSPLGARNQEITFAMRRDGSGMLPKIIEHGKLRRGWLGVE